jgi:hypothetical protein
MIEGHLLFYGEDYNGSIPGLTLKDQVNVNKYHFPLPPRSTAASDTLPPQSEDTRSTTDEAILA